MLIDTSDKRASALQFEEPWGFELPAPDGTIDAGDRQHLVQSYRGFAAENPSLIDSRDNRASALQFSEPWGAALPVPDGTISDLDRQHLSWDYRGHASLVGGGVGGYDRRASSVQFGEPWQHNLPLPDGNIDAADRQHLSWDYRGILPIIVSFINTRDKRASALQYQEPWQAFLPVPDFVIGPPDRLHLAWNYRGITADAPAVFSQIDTRDKRASALQFEEPWQHNLPLPDADVNIPDRQHLAWSYRGIAAFVSAQVYTSAGATVSIMGQGVGQGLSIYVSPGSGHDVAIFFRSITGSGTFLSSDTPIGIGGGRLQFHAFGTGNYVGSVNGVALNTAALFKAFGVGSYSNSLGPYTGTGFSAAEFTGTGSGTFARTLEQSIVDILLDTVMDDQGTTLREMIVDIHTVATGRATGLRGGLARFYQRGKVEPRIESRHDGDKRDDPTFNRS